MLAAFDLTPVSRRVAERARLMAVQHEAELQLVHVDEPLREAFIDRGLERKVRAHRRSSAEDLAEWVRRRGATQAQLSVPAGSPAAILGRMSEDADLLVVGTSSVDTARVGPIAARVARTSRAPVLAVRRQPRVPYRRVLAGVDLSSQSCEAVDLVLRLLPGSEVTAVFAFSYRFEGQLGDAGLFPEEVQHLRKLRRERAEEALTAFAARWEGRVTPLLVEGPPSEVMEELVRRRAADLVAVGRRGWGGTPAPLLGTVAETVLAAVPCDVLVAR